jgi:hypothetical protein
MWRAMLKRTFGLLTICAGLGGCVPFPDPPLTSRAVDPTSPVANTILRADNAERPPAYPTFRGIPAVPTDLRPADDWNKAVTALQGAGAELDEWKRANPAELTDTEQFAARTRAEVGLDPANLPPAPTPEESAAFAREQVQRATPR